MPFEVTGRDGSIWVQRVGLLLTRTANILRFTDAQALADRLNAAEAAHATLTEGGGHAQMKFNWVSLIGLIAPVVMGIQQIHASAPGATKKQLAMESLGLATAAADAVLPPDQKATADAVSGLIDQFVTLFHATNAPGFGTNSAASAA